MQKKQPVKRHIYNSMKKLIVLAIIFLFSGTIAVVVANAQKFSYSKPLALTTPVVTPVAQPQPLTTVPPKEKVDLPVPHIWEIPDGVWVKPWNNACEEAAIVNVEEFYLNRGEVKLPAKEIKTKLLPLFAWEDKTFGSNADTDSKRTNRIINEYSSFEGTIKENPTLEEMKAELAAGHPIISFHYGYDMKNPHHRFRRGGSSYHVVTITGYDDTTGEFMVNDSELKDALDYRYPYAIIMGSLHDFDHTRRKADGTPVVIFTRAKQIVKAEGKGATYLIQGDKKHYIAHPRVFKNRRWSWSAVKTVSAEWLQSLENGSAISN